MLRDVIVVAHFFIVLGLSGRAAGLGAAIEHVDESHLPYGTVAALAVGIGLYHVAHVEIAWRYGIQPVTLALLGVVGLLAAAVLLLFGAGWPSWLLVAVLLVDAVDPR